MNVAFRIRFPIRKNTISVFKLKRIGITTKTSFIPRVSVLDNSQDGVVIWRSRFRYNNHLLAGLVTQLAHIDLIVILMVVVALVRVRVQNTVFQVINRVLAPLPAGQAHRRAREVLVRERAHVVLRNSAVELVIENLQHMVDRRQLPGRPNRAVAQQIAHCLS